MLSKGDEVCAVCKERGVPIILTLHYLAEPVLVQISSLMLPFACIFPCIPLVCLYNAIYGYACLGKVAPRQQLIDQCHASM